MKKILTAILILSVFDILLTYAGYKMGFIEEVNPLFQEIFQISPELTSLFILVFVCSMLYIINKFGHKFKYMNIGLIVMMLVKIYIMYVHFEWVKMVV